MSTLTWGKNCEGRQYLVKQFQLFDTTGGREGIDYNKSKLLKPKELKELFDKHDTLQGYKRDRFPTNFVDTVSAYKIDTLKINARKQGMIVISV